ncbi:hypothetical protein PAMP_024140 [Pampus punctatissimus]
MNRQGILSGKGVILPEGGEELVVGYFRISWGFVGIPYGFVISSSGELGDSQEKSCMVCLQRLQPLDLRELPLQCQSFEMQQASQLLSAPCVSSAGNVSSLFPLSSSLRSLSSLSLRLKWFAEGVLGTWLGAPLTTPPAPIPSGQTP